MSNVLLFGFYTTMKHHDEWWKFKDAVWARLEMGEAHYGETTFRKDPAAITREIDEEILDVAAYAFMLWCRVKALRGRLAAEPAFKLLDPPIHDAASAAAVAKLRRDLG